MCIHQDKKNIVTVCWYKVYPAVNGGHNCVTQFAEALSAQHQSYFLCSKDNVTHHQFVFPELPVAKWQIFNPFNLRKIVAFVKKHKANIVILEHPYYALIHFWLKKMDIKLIVRTHNIEYRRLNKTGRWYWPIVKKLEAFAYKKADKIWCLTKEDKQSIVDWLSIDQNKISITPSGVPMQNVGIKDIVRSKHSIQPDSKLFLYAASFYYKPNIDGYYLLANHILPKLQQNYTLVVCGVGAEQLKKEKDNIIIAGFVPSLDDYYAGADIVVNPVQQGEGVQTKILESVAHNKNIVVFSNMIAGVPDYLIEKKVFVANNNQEFIVKINEAMESHHQTPDLFFETHNWETIVNGLQF